MARQDATMTTSAEDAAMLAQATNGTAPAAATNGTSTATEPAAPAKRTRTRREPSDDPNELFGITVRVPQELKNKLDESAKAQDTSTPQFILRGLAGWYEYKLPEAAKKTRRVQKYATEAEKKQAQRDSQAASRLRVRALLAAVEDGKIDVDIDALVADLKAKQEAAAAEDAATAAANSTATEQPAEMATAGAGAAS